MFFALLLSTVTDLNGHMLPFQLVRQGPSPGDHEVSGDLCWDENKKTFLMFPKRKTWPYAPRGMVVTGCRVGDHC